MKNKEKEKTIADRLGDPQSRFEMEADMMFPTIERQIRGFTMLGTKILRYLDWLADHRPDSCVRYQELIFKGELTIETDDTIENELRKLHES